MWTKHILKPLHVVWASSQHGSSVRRQESQETARWNSIAFYDLISEDMEGHCFRVVFIGMESLRPARIQGERNQNPPLNEKNVKEFADCCEEKHHSTASNRNCLNSSHMKMTFILSSDISHSKQFHLSLH